MSHRLDKLGRQIDGLDEDLAVLGETVALFVRFWMTITAPLSETVHASARAKRLGAVRGLLANAWPAARNRRQVPERAVAGC